MKVLAICAAAILAIGTVYEAQQIEIEAVEKEIASEMGSDIESERECGDFWNPQISASTSSFDETSPDAVDPGCNLITVCLTTQSSSGSASISYFEVLPDGSQTGKWSATVVAPWDGCYSGISFTVQDNSRIRLLVRSNSIQQVHQMNAG